MRELSFKKNWFVLCAAAFVQLVLGVGFFAAMFKDIHVPAAVMAVAMIFFSVYFLGQCYQLRRLHQDELDGVEYEEDEE